ncbi:hypothetical protein N8133_00615 [bacterium]|nr:hypothetical protein [bacterium]
MNENGSCQFDKQNLDELLSLRGKPFADWKEERLYLREKWGVQGRKVEPVVSSTSSDSVEEEGQS